MKLVDRTLLIWVPLAILNAAWALSGQGVGYSRIGAMLLRDASVLMAILSFVLYKSEIRRGAKFVFLNYALFFSFMGTLNPGVALMLSWLHVTDEWSWFYYTQYGSLSYFLLLSFSVAYMVVDSAFKGWRIYQKYLITVIVVGCTWGYLSYPYLADPKYLYTTKYVQYYRDIRDAMKDLEKGGISQPTVEQIASVVKFRSPERAKAEMTLEDRQARVAEILPYFSGDDYIPLIWRAFFWDCMAMSAACVILILSLVLYQYLVDPPEGAYVEKIVWLVLLFCAFEMLHHYAFATVRTYETLVELYAAGYFITLASTVALMFLFIVRLRFIRSIEGSYYERQLMSDASRITRWRDAFDNWVLRQFMDPRELNGRFLVQHKARES